jgi:hypothetical protein
MVKAIKVAIERPNGRRAGPKAVSLARRKKGLADIAISYLVRHKVDKAAVQPLVSMLYLAHCYVSESLDLGSLNPHYDSFSVE